ncbi:MAG: SGNH/GDSL hydrolase family protein [Planctomycetota bacterium]|nr:SGNH/GDSL hydrolase family protein [Planctomycetota bacterium]
MKFRRSIAAVVGWACITAFVAHTAWTVEPAPPAKSLQGKRVMVLGDSITQNGLYVSFIEYFLMKSHAPKDVDIISIGLSSETTSGLSERVHPGPRPCVFSRLQRALEGVKPQIVVACYGMNDGIYLPLSAERMKAFQDGITRLVKESQAAGAEVILLTPPVFDPIPYGERVSQDDTGPGYTKPYAKYDDVLAEYGKWVMGLKMNGLITVDLHTEMAEYLAKRRASNPKFILSGDGIHPGDLGHLLMAYAFMRGIGMPVPAGDLEAELARIQADPLFQLVKKHRETRSGKWLPYSQNRATKEAVDEAEKAAAALLTQIADMRQK